ncbi:unnamed protein product [Nippostrongylus brasiliensis]|uniref:Uncharacterized protein n=1 Tax=Nippostrongylus brasiliensis TaxID=27835 RepID=A0A0N4Y3I4_NIPBR|nr:unnamed protein product [Nippostrongylus brasiliensis]
MVDKSIEEEERCSSSLMVTRPSSAQAAPLPTLEQLLGRIPLAGRVTVDVGVSHQSMLQSLHSVFATQKSDSETAICEEPNVLASAVKIAQKKQIEAVTPALPRVKSDDTVEYSKKKKERRRRKKRSGERTEPEPDGVTNPVDQELIVAKPSDVVTPPPNVPYIPSRVLEQSLMPLQKLGSFEAKEKVLRALREKLGCSEESC